MKRQQPIIALDLLRATAALIVVLVHVRAGAFVVFGDLPAAQQTLPAKLFFGLTRSGREAVLVFFVLSGFLVGGQIIRRVQEGRFSVSAYALERSTRILAPLIPACLLTVAINWRFFDLPPDWGQAVLNMVGLNGVVVAQLPNNNPLWTLAYEIWFYVLAGAAGAAIGRRTPPAAALFFLAAATCVFALLDARFLLFWCMGALSALFLDVPARGRLFALGALLLMIGSPAYQLTVDSTAFANVAVMPASLAEALICLGVCAMLPLLCDPRLNARLAPLARVAAAASGVSYSLYVTHHPLNEALSLWLPRAATLSPSSFAVFALKVALVLVFAQAFHWAFESRTPALRERLRRLLTTPPAIEPRGEARTFEAR